MPPGRASVAQGIHGQYPELAERIRTVFPALLVMEEVGHGGGLTTALHADPSGSGTPTPQRLGDYVLLRRSGSMAGPTRGAMLTPWEQPYTSC
jgi:hypothetical protein